MEHLADVGIEEEEEEEEEKEEEAEEEKEEEEGNHLRKESVPYCVNYKESVP
jgi:hypothetical protein